MFIENGWWYLVLKYVLNERLDISMFQKSQTPAAPSYRIAHSLIMSPLIMQYQLVTKDVQHMSGQECSRLLQEDKTSDIRTA